MTTEVETVAGPSEKKTSEAESLSLKKKLFFSTHGSSTTAVAGASNLKNGHVRHFKSSYAGSERIHPPLVTSHSLPEVDLDDDEMPGKPDCTTFHRSRRYLMSSKGYGRQQQNPSKCLKILPFKWLFRCKLDFLYASVFEASVSRSPRISFSGHLSRSAGSEGGCFDSQWQYERVCPLLFLL
ncbi:hypothetical protein L596_004175 [Steinernema carpocapsae]|uniref:Uncharacterized protein n=1 Tax=Steinernema carpocapsae TaxID=34508 RepID=A0A4U8UV33_STECR|nr:hypothetical protein L596_004175 [Steinernema carpocapsae]